jgi:hypothetical protein
MTNPLRRIRPLIDDQAIRHACRDLYAPIGRPSIPPEQLLLALVGGYLLHRSGARPRHRGPHCGRAARQRPGARAGAHVGAWRGLPALAALSEADRRELFGEAKDWHGLRRFRRRGRWRVQQGAYLIGWVLNLKRPAKRWAPVLQPT